MRFTDDQRSLITQIIDRDLPDEMPPDSQRIHNAYKDYLRAMIAEHSGPELAICDALDINQEALDRWTASSWETFKLHGQEYPNFQSALYSMAFVAHGLTVKP